VIFSLLTIVISTVTSEIRFFSASDLTTLSSTLADTLEGFAQNVKSVLASMHISSEALDNTLKQVADLIAGTAGFLGEQIAASANALPAFFTQLTFAIIFAVYFMIDGTGLKRYWDKVLKAFTTTKAYGNIHSFAANADRVFSGYIRGTLLDVLFMGVVISIVLWAIGVKYSVIIGILTGIGNLIPYVGPLVAYVSTILVCLMNWNLEKMVLALIMILIIQTVDGNLVEPKLMSSSIDIHPMLVIAALITGGAIGGLGGMFLAVPCAGLLNIYFDKLIDFLLTKRNRSGEGNTDN
jgi:predicted PurR-regulated permease PerM